MGCQPPALGRCNDRDSARYTSLRAVWIHSTSVLVCWSNSIVCAEALTEYPHPHEWIDDSLSQQCPCSNAHAYRREETSTMADFNACQCLGGRPKRTLATCTRFQISHPLTISHFPLTTNAPVRHNFYTANGSRPVQISAVERLEA